METIPMDIVCIECRKIDEDTVKRLFFATNPTTAKMENVSKTEANRRLANGAGLIRLGTMENPTDPFGMLPDHEGELNYMEEL